jgi:hypothetical protein
MRHFWRISSAIAPSDLSAYASKMRVPLLRAKSALKFLGALVLLAVAFVLTADDWNTAHLSDDALRAKAVQEYRRVQVRSVADERDDAMIGLAVGGGMVLASLGVFGFWWKTLPFRKPASNS